MRNSLEDRGPVLTWARFARTGILCTSPLFLCQGRQRREARFCGNDRPSGTGATDGGVRQVVHPADLFGGGAGGHDAGAGPAADGFAVPDGREDERGRRPARRDAAERDQAGGRPGKRGAARRASRTPTTAGSRCSASRRRAARCRARAWAPTSPRRRSCTSGSAPPNAASWRASSASSSMGCGRRRPKTRERLRAKSRQESRSVGYKPEAPAKGWTKSFAGASGLCRPARSVSSNPSLRVQACVGPR